MNLSTISVALCTHNGERFLRRQLASIALQTRQPDELVVCDDCSTDQTVQILREFAAGVSFPVRLMENREKLGSAANFEKAIRHCAGSLIALCDQDDEWSRSRLEQSERELLTHTRAGLVFSDGNMIDDQGASVGKRLWQAFAFTPDRRRELAAGNYDLLVKYRFVTGATVMFRADLRDCFLPIPSGWIHDEWIVAMLAVFSEVVSIDEPLISYRQHAAQQVGSPDEKLPSSSIAEVWNTLSQGDSNDSYWSGLDRNIRFAQTLEERLSAASLDERGREVLASYRSWLQFARFRVALPRTRLHRLFPVLRHYSWYAKHALGFRSAMKDLVRTRA